ncbi:diguanylate cyclase, partial [Candidatus Gracilibacteria bacterium]|nr:diguanylate cyclase [Candidatus Gracilibacteria bacterium]
MLKEKLKNNQKKILFNTTKTYLLRLIEKYKLRGYEKIFLEKEFNYLEDINNAAVTIDNFNLITENLNSRILDSIQKLESINNIDFNFKEKLTEKVISFYEDFILLIEQIAKNQEIIIQSIDDFYKIEKEIDIKTESLTKYGFDKEVKYIFDNLQKNKHKEITIIIFDQNNLKNINETYGHYIGQESIWKFGSILKEELNKRQYNYILSNYYGGDEWFLILIDVDKKDSKKFVQKIFNTIKDKLVIKNFNIKIGACAGIVYYKPSALFYDEIESKSLIKLADSLVLKSKVQKSGTKSGNSYKFIDFVKLSRKNLMMLNKQIHVLPKKLKEETLTKKTLRELLNLRKKQNEKIIKARTLGVKKIIQDNIELL